MNVVLVTRGANVWVYFLIDGLLRNGVRVTVFNERREPESSSLTSDFRKRRGWIAYLDLLLLRWVTRIGQPFRRQHADVPNESPEKFDPERPLGFKYALQEFRIRLEPQSSEYNWADVSSVNSAESIDLIRSVEPTFIILCGAPILKKEFVDSFDNIINCHCGIAPHYRGSSPAFWAIYLNDPDNIGYTIHRVTYKLDAGPILYQEKIKLKYLWTLEEIDWFLIVTMYLKLLELVVSGQLGQLVSSGLRQEEGISRYPMGYIRQTLTRCKLHLLYRKRLPSRQFWDRMARLHHTTGTQDYIVAAFDQRMRIKSVESLLDDYGLAREGRDTLLDFGCGSGDFIRHFASRCKSAVGYDLSQEILRVAHAVTMNQPNVHLLNSLDSWPERFDLVFSITVLQHVLDDEDVKRTIDKIACLCKPGAHFIALESFETPSYPVLQPRHVKARDRAAWGSIFHESGFEILEMRNFYNPYLIPCSAFKQYIASLGALKTSYRFLRRGFYIPEILLRAIDRKAELMVSSTGPRGGFVNEDSLSKFIVARKVGSTSQSVTLERHQSASVRRNKNNGSS